MFWVDFENKSILDYGRQNTAVYIRIYSSGDKGRLCLLGNIKEGPTSNVYILVYFWFLPPCPEAKHVRKQEHEVAGKEHSKFRLQGHFI